MCIHAVSNEHCWSYNVIILIFSVASDTAKVRMSKSFGPFSNTFPLLINQNIAFIFLLSINKNGDYSIITRRRKNLLKKKIFSYPKREYSRKFLLLNFYERKKINKQNLIERRIPCTQIQRNPQRKKISILALYL